MHNLYLYLTLYSCHLLGFIKGMICGQIKRIHDLIAKNEGTVSSVFHFFEALQDRGYSANAITPYFLAAKDKYQREPAVVLPALKQTTKKHTCVHLRFNFYNPTCSAIQDLFRKYILQPTEETPLPDLLNHKDIL